MGRAQDRNNVGGFPIQTALLLLSLPIVLAGYAFFLQVREDLFGVKVSAADVYHIKQDYDAFPGSRHMAREATDTDSQAEKETAKVQMPQLVAKGTGFEGALQLKPATGVKGTKVCIATTTGDGLDRIIPWLKYHRSIGIDMFYLFAEEKTATPEVASVLETMPDVLLWKPSKALDQRRAGSRIWGESWLRGFFNKPCNHALFVRQNLNLEIAIKQAALDEMDWILHIDTDELMYPGGAPNYSLRTVLASIKDDVHTVVFPNYESIVENDHVQDPFNEVTLFKRNFDHVIRETYFSSYRDVTRENPNYFLTYGNGKSAARIRPGLRPNGAHRFHSYKKPPYEIKASEAAVLHYTYARFSDIANRKHRCVCKLGDEDLKKCFILDFDRLAYKMSSTMAEDKLRQWYRNHVVWTDKSVVTKLVANGLFDRIYTPQVILQGMMAQEAIQVTRSKDTVLQNRTKDLLAINNNSTRERPSAVLSAQQKKLVTEAVMEALKKNAAEVLSQTR
uniref:Glycosyltransferase family 92 protein n=1 Tax=Pyramimonas obovata TaxID=1411642 RepID=A0A7S0RE07_9CHLO|mmetsp:Transcript_31359/g.68555  ORF Transcript_31359/g.68555 Transcript_31359/m.68555 type:complete len:506 (+) Transcript_31359:280-1797(+)|eukprot:CAMPEP_0118926076 /NCGR_PEP_ID=MMETSP1169-20130426/3856_1 /TAXON_ID=36882 /ORGANISM="Pyramimonas obovata, Strain CCMP722" /LENGTH=505 /DNA_ID=CAMNT_0006867553 /DNA_START=219 /DNA_END=1736 /DNA_ORIENTATION=+